MKNYLKHLVSIAAVVLCMGLHINFAHASSTLQCPLNNTSYVTMGGDQYTSGATGLVTNTGGGHNQTSLLAQGCAPVGLSGYQIGASGTAGTLTIYPATASYGYLQLTDTGNSGAFNTIITNASVGQADTLTIPDPGAATASFMLTKGAQTIAGANTFTKSDLILLGSSTGATTLNSGLASTSNNTLTLPTTATDTLSAIGTTETYTAVKTFGAGSGIVSKVSNDFGVPFSSTITANPGVYTVTGSLTTSQVSTGTTILTGVAGRTITVTNFNLNATGTPATCTGVYIEDTSAVKVATVLVAALSSGTNALPLAANTGAGFAVPLTSGGGVQIATDGSNCTTMTAIAYTLTYSIQ